MRLFVYLSALALLLPALPGAALADGAAAAARLDPFHPPVADPQTDAKLDQVRQEMDAKLAPIDEKMVKIEQDVAGVRDALAVLPAKPEPASLVPPTPLTPPSPTPTPGPPAAKPVPAAAPKLRLVGCYDGQAYFRDPRGHAVLIPAAMAEQDCGK